MKWIKREDASPPEGIGILIFSPAYVEVHFSMRYRIIDSQFFNLMGEATHWAFLEGPEENAQD